MTQEDATKFGKLLALLASDQMGERSAAAAMATNFLAQRKLDWHDVGAMICGKPELQDEPSLYQMAQKCLASGYPWRENELSFLHDMTAWRKPSEKQAKWLAALYGRIAN